MAFHEIPDGALAGGEGPTGGIAARYVIADEAGRRALAATGAILSVHGEKDLGLDAGDLGDLLGELMPFTVVPGLGRLVDPFQDGMALGAIRNHNGGRNAGIHLPCVNHRMGRAIEPGPGASRIGIARAVHDEHAPALFLHEVLHGRALRGLPSAGGSPAGDVVAEENLVVLQLGGCDIRAGIDHVDLPTLGRAHALQGLDQVLGADSMIVAEEEVGNQERFKLRSQLIRFPIDGFDARLGLRYGLGLGQAGDRSQQGGGKQDRAEGYGFQLSSPIQGSSPKIGLI